MFMELDQGAILRKESGLDRPGRVRLVIGNPLIMEEMAKRVPDAGSRRSLFWWTNGQMAYTLLMTLMTKWRAYWLPTEVQTPWPSHGI